MAEQDGDYSVLHVETKRGAYMRVYFDAASEQIARARAPCLGMQLNLLQAELGDTRNNAQWNAVVFTSDAKYAPPRGVDHQTRWVMRTDVIDAEVANIETMLLAVIPHEQVHEFQTRIGVGLPRWFSEGHATWAAIRIYNSLRPGLAAEKRDERIAKLEQSVTPVDLSRWTSVRPKREAIMRQVSPEDRARMEQDPDYSPTGSFTFTMDDFEDDESNMEARYGAAMLVFEGLEKRHGAAAVRDWAKAVTASANRVDEVRMAQSVREHFGEDLDVLLSEPNKEAFAR
ncbi:MAG: hypothetical protein WA908_10505 [Pontixanthobacter sp.]